MLPEPTQGQFSIFLLLTIMVSLIFGPENVVSFERNNQLINNDIYSKTKESLEDLIDVRNSSLSDMETLLRYESELQTMLHVVRNHMDNILIQSNDLASSNNNRVVRDVVQVEMITNDVSMNITNNATLASLLPQNINVTTLPVVFRLFNLLANGATDFYSNTTISTTAVISDNRTTSDPVTTDSSPVKQTPIADKPYVKNSNNVASGPDVETTFSPLLEPFRNSRHSGLSDLLMNVTKCTQLTEEQLVKELKQQGTYNPDFMAWDVRGVLNFFEKATTDSYDKVKKVQDRSRIAEQNLAAIEALVKELNLKNCNLRAPDVLAKLYNFSLPRQSSFDQDSDRLRTKRDDDNNKHMSDIEAQTRYLFDLYSNSYRDESPSQQQSSSTKKDKKSEADDDIIGQVHIVPFGCRKRGTSEDGYLRLCGACQAIRRLPDNFFPPFINEVTCDEDKACLYFYDYPHGKCKQKHLNFVVLQNIGTSDCQLWRRFNLNVRVSCECFVDEMSFFAKYV